MSTAAAVSPRLLYVAGPYGNPKGPAFVQRNIREAWEVSLQLWSLRVGNICPHANSAHMDGAATWSVFIDGCLGMVSRLDGVVMLPGWPRSVGAIAERAHARELGKPVFEWETEFEKIVDFAWPDGVPLDCWSSAVDVLPGGLYERLRRHTVVRGFPLPAD
jgi:hypothetical protein